MSIQELERLVRKYYGCVADLEGSGVGFRPALRAG